MTKKLQLVPTSREPYRSDMRAQLYRAQSRLAELHASKERLKSDEKASRLTRLRIQDEIERITSDLALPL